jgi:hypothetical protein
MEKSMEQRQLGYLYAFGFISAVVLTLYALALSY